MKRKIIIVAIVVVGAVSLLSNIYYFGNAWLQKDRQVQFVTGYNTAKQQIIETVQRDGKVVVGDDKMQIELIERDINLE